MTCNKYTIHHLDLSTEVVSVPADKSEGHYLVLWYGSVPLGHCYLSAHQLDDREIFTQEIFQAIAPALRYYSSMRHVLSALDSSTAVHALSDVRHLCETVIRPYLQIPVKESCDISVVVCTRDRAQQLRTCLHSLHNQRCKPIEIIVVDNGSSTDETRNVALAFEGVTYIREPRVGLDIARNTGVKRSRGAIVAFTDDDTVVDPYWLFRISQSFEQKDVVATTGLILAGSLQDEAEVIFEKYWPFNRGYIAKLYDRKFFNTTLASGPPVWEIGAGANMAFKREIFDIVGLFDERLDAGAAGCSGDSELWYRILANGFRILYNPMAVVRHFHRSSLTDLKRQLYAYMKGFTVAILIQHQRFGHRGNLQHLFRVIPGYYIKLLFKGFPLYGHQYLTVFDEMRGILSGMIYFLRHRNSNSGIYCDYENF